MIALTRRYRFPAAHVLCNDAFSDEENRRLFGKCANPNGHGHNYGLEVTVSGPVDAKTGRIIDPDRLDAVVRERVLDRFSHRMLNDDPAFERQIPTAENLARVVHDELAGPVASNGGPRIVRVRIVETLKNTFDYGTLP